MVFSVLFSVVSCIMLLGLLREQELAVQSTISPGAFADISVVSLMARCPVVTRAVFASADWRAAVLAVVPWRTGAGIVIDPILAGATIGTRVGGTIIQVVITVSPAEAIQALADVGISKIDTVGTVGTGVGAAVINFLFAVEARVRQRASTAVAAFRVVGAAASVEAGPIGAGHGAQLAVFTVEAWWTGAGVAVFKIRAAASVLAGAGFAFVDLNLAVGTSVPRAAGARVAALAGVGAGGRILAGLVMGAVVEILIAEESTPPFLAVALPGLLAGAMQAARVSDALVTIAPLPAHSAFAFSGPVTKSVLLVAAGQTDCLSAVLALPALITLLLAALPAGEVPKCVVPGAAED